MTTLRSAYTIAQERLSALESLTTYSRTAHQSNITSYFSALAELTRLETLACRNARYAQLESMFKEDDELEATMAVEFEDDGLDHTLAELLLESARMAVDEFREAVVESRAQYAELTDKMRPVKEEVRELMIACRNWAEMRESEVEWEGRRGGIMFDYKP